MLHDYGEKTNSLTEVVREAHLSIIRERAPLESGLYTASHARRSLTRGMLLWDARTAALCAPSCHARTRTAGATILITYFTPFILDKLHEW